mmetsp:Transcript_30460/g.70823  ORF Transcript_30460/g.70823 Transcript_30460/m.70823 type:complete len:215 (+) Transcript_30460:890-1534(+)
MGGAWRTLVVARAPGRLRGWRRHGCQRCPRPRAFALSCGKRAPGDLLQNGSCGYGRRPAPLRPAARPCRQTSRWRTRAVRRAAQCSGAGAPATVQRHPTAVPMTAPRLATASAARLALGPCSSTRRTRGRLPRAPAPPCAATALAAASSRTRCATPTARGLPRARSTSYSRRASMAFGRRAGAGTGGECTFEMHAAAHSTTTKAPQREHMHRQR